MSRCCYRVIRFGNRKKSPTRSLEIANVDSLKPIVSKAHRIGSVDENQDPYLEGHKLWFAADLCLP